MKYICALFSILLFSQLILAQENNIISKIIITGNRVNESVIRNRLAFKEGDVFDESKAEQSKSNLYSLGLFKSLDISSKTDEAAGGVTVTVDARDGWFVLPWPFFGSRGGTRYAGGMLIEQNYFKNAERILIFGNYQEDASFNSVSFMFPEFNFSAVVDRRSFTEYRYADGAYNSGLIVWDDISEILKYGPVSDSYDKELDSLRFNAGKSFGKDFSLSAGIFTGNVNYSNSISAPEDKGRINAVHVSAVLGKMGSRADMLSGFGRMFGLGMADLNDKLKPYDGFRTDYGFQASLESANKGIGSDLAYNKAALSANRITVFRGRNQFAVHAKTGFGSSVPSSQLFATNRREGMKGTYAREFRGDAIAIMNTAYRHSFSRNSSGQLNGEIYAEYAAAFLNGCRKEKEGAGINLAYQFWRFPLPLGFGYTYSFDDSDWQVSAAVGGMF